MICNELGLKPLKLILTMNVIKLWRTFKAIIPLNNKLCVAFDHTALAKLHINERHTPNHVTGY